MSEFDNIMKTIGLYKIYILLFILVIIGIALSFLTVQSFTYNNNNLKLYNAIIVDSSCREIINNNYYSSFLSFTCNLTIEFITVDNKKIIKKYIKPDNNIKYEKGDIIEIYYDHTTDEILESDISNDKFKYLIFLIICLVIGYFIFNNRNNDSVKYFFGLDTLFFR